MGLRLTIFLRPSTRSRPPRPSRNSSFAFATSGNRLRKIIRPCTRFMAQASSYRTPSPSRSRQMSQRFCWAKMKHHAAARGIHIEEVESSLEGDIDLHGFLDLDPKVRKGYEGIRVNFKIKADVPEEQLAEIAQ